MPAASLLTLPSEIRIKIYRLTAQKVSTLRLRALFAITLNSAHEDPNYHLRIPSHLLKVCRMIHQETVPILYSSLRLSTPNLEQASDFIRNIGPKNTTYMASITVHCTSSIVGISQIAHWLDRYTSLLHRVRHIEISYVFYTTRRPCDPALPAALLQRLNNMLFDSPSWAEHRMRCDGFEQIPLHPATREYKLKLVKGGAAAGAGLQAPSPLEG